MEPIALAMKENVTETATKTECGYLRHPIVMIIGYYSKAMPE